MTDDIDLTLLTGFGGEEKFIAELLRLYLSRIGLAPVQMDWEQLANRRAPSVRYLCSNCACSFATSALSCFVNRWPIK